MGNRQLNETYNKYRKVFDTRGDMDSLDPFFDYFLMDASYYVFDKKIRTLGLKQEKKKIVGRISEYYNRYFEKIHCAFNADELDYLLQKTDEFQAFLANHVQIARIALMECYNDRSLDEQEKIADLWLCFVLAKEAQSCHGNTWKSNGFRNDFRAGDLRVRGQIYTYPEIDKDIDGVESWCKALSVLLVPDGEAKQKNHDRFWNSVSVLTKKIYEWLNKDYQNERKNIGVSRTA